MATVTAKEIAKELGISQASVSLALNDKPGVSEETRRLVRETAIHRGMSLPTLQPYSGSGKRICFLIFVIFPTAVTRPELMGDSIWIRLLQLLYALDKPDNTFPSVHCLVGWFCWIGIRGKKDIPLLCRAASLLMALAVCFSTLAVRQHVLLDVPGGILLSELCYRIAGSEKFLCSYSAFIDKLMIGAKRIKE